MSANRPLRAGVTRTPINLDMEQPAGFTNEISSDLNQNLYDQLTEPTSIIGADGTRRIDWRNLTPALAESWSVDATGKSWVFTLRQGILSHAGNEMTADDVKYGWDRAFAQRDIGKWVARISSIPSEEAIQPLDRYRIRFDLAKRNPMLARAQAQCTPSVYDSAVVKDHATDEDPWAKNFLNTNEAGFGPYKLASFSAEETILTAHDQYWRGKPSIDEVRLRPYGTVENAIEALRAGEINLVQGVPLAVAPSLARQGFRLSTAESTSGLALHLDPADSPFGDIRVRQAIAHLVPYQEIMQTAYLGTARPWGSWVPPEAPGYAGDVWPYEENEAKARDLLAAAGLSGGFETRLAIRAGDGTDIATQIILDALARVGITATVETAVRTPPGQKANPAPMFLHGQSSPGRGVRVYDPLYSLFHDYGPGRMRLFRYTFESPEMYAEMDAMSDAGDTQEWIDHARNAQAYLNAEAVVIPICAYRSIAAFSKDLAGYRWYPDNTIPFADMSWR